MGCPMSPKKIPKCNPKNEKHGCKLGLVNGLAGRSIVAQHGPKVEPKRASHPLHFKFQDVPNIGFIHFYIPVQAVSVEKRPECFITFG